MSLNTSDGLVLTTEHATFTEAEGLLRGPGPVKFQRGNMSGSGVGFTYDRQQDSVRLLDQAVIRFAATPQKAAMDVSSATAGYSRLQRYARFDRNVRMTRDHQVITADASTIFMQAQIDEPDRIELRGQSHITGGGSMGTLQTMQARDIILITDRMDARWKRRCSQAMPACNSAVGMVPPRSSCSRSMSIYRSRPTDR